MTDATASTALTPIAFTMLPGAGPACEGDDCLPSASLSASDEDS